MPSFSFQFQHIPVVKRLDVLADSLHGFKRFCELSTQAYGRRLST